MTSPLLRRLPIALSALALTSTALVAGTMAPAAAAPVEGVAHANAYAEFGNGCDIDNGATSQNTTYRNGQGERTAYAHAQFSGEAEGVRGFMGESEVTTTVEATARRRAFKSVELEVAHVVLMANDSAVDCGAEIHALSNGDGGLRVRRAGRIKVRWSGTGGDISSISLTAPSGRMLINTDPSTPSGSTTVNVRPGLFSYFTQIRTSMTEASVPADGNSVDINTFTVTLTYLPPA